MVARAGLDGGDEGDEGVPRAGPGLLPGRRFGLAGGAAAGIATEEKTEQPVATAAPSPMPAEASEF